MSTLANFPQHTPTTVEVSVARTAPARAQAVGWAVGTSGPVPRQIGLSRAALGAQGFTGGLGQTLVIPRADGATAVAVGVGDPTALSVNDLRRAAASFTRAVSARAHLATHLVEVGAEHGLDVAASAQAVTEGVLLGAYRYVGLKNESGSANALESLTLLASAPRVKATEAGAAAGQVTARAGRLARDLANTPPAYLTARRFADIAVELAAQHGLGAEVFTRDQLEAMGCGGIVGVNAGSVEPPRMVRLTYTPRRATGHLAMVGKGVMYDSGGISLKPSDPMHAVMKMDMSGAAAVLCAMTTLGELKVRTQVTAYLMCTDNMPSGSALKLGDVLTIRNGRTVEIHNTDAEGRLILADGLSLAVEDAPDAIVDIATLTGAALAALGPEIAAVLGTSDAFVGQVAAAADRTEEPVWRLPLERDRYRKMLDSVVADMRNIGGPYAGTITASIFLSEFVGQVPWAHLDIAGPMKSDGDDGVWSKGATGFGTRLLIDLARNFTPPA